MWSNLSDSRTQSQICCDNKRTQRQWQPHKLEFMALFAPEISHSIKATVIQSHKSVNKSMVFTLYSLLRLSDGDHSTFQLCRPRLINARVFFCFFVWKRKKLLFTDVVDFVLNSAQRILSCECVSNVRSSSSSFAVKIVPAMSREALFFTIHNWHDEKSSYSNN